MFSWGVREKMKKERGKSDFSLCGWRQKRGERKWGK